VKSPPLLAWRPYPGATYYNVQLYFGVGNTYRRLASLDVSGKKVLSAWPLQPRYRLAKTWKEQEEALARAGALPLVRLPGIGKKSANKYGPLIGSSDFYVVRR
jgi:hypothetical protein